jgi:dolichyl-diphosphooligosaccharide--protein glycosyltransferase
VAPLLDSVIATAVFITQGRDAQVQYIERVAAIVPSIVGVLAVAAVWALAGITFDRRAGLIAGFLAAIFPGHFLDRTLIGFVDHHALEVLLSLATLAALAFAVLRPAASLGRYGALAAGTFLGLYLLAWASGAYLVAILTTWVALAALICPADQARTSARVASISAAVALVIVLLLQDPGLFRYNTQVASLLSFFAVSMVVLLPARRLLIAIAVLAGAALLIVGAAAIAG